METQISENLSYTAMVYAVAQCAGEDDYTMQWYNSCFGRHSTSTYWIDFEF